MVTIKDKLYAVLQRNIDFERMRDPTQKNSLPLETWTCSEAHLVGNIEKAIKDHEATAGFWNECKNMKLSYNAGMI